MAYYFKFQHPFIIPNSEDRIETIPFLLASREILHLLDYLGPSYLQSAFERTRDDISGNITTLQKKYDSDPKRYHLLLQMIEDEIKSEEIPSTVALLWLKRGLEFIYHFCKLIVNDNIDNKMCESLCDYTLNAYELSLKRFHNFFLKGVFYVVAHILPYKSTFIKHLAGDQDNHEKEVLNELENFVNALYPNLEIINKLFIRIGRNEDC